MSGDILVTWHCMPSFFRNVFLWCPLASVSVPSATIILMLYFILYIFSFWELCGLLTVLDHYYVFKNYNIKDLYCYILYFSCTFIFYHCILGPNYTPPSTLISFIFVIVILVTYCYFGNISVLSDVGYFQCLFSTDLLWMMLFYYDIPERQSVSVMKYHSLEFFL